MFQRRHYEAVAAVLRAWLSGEIGHYAVQTAFAEDNPNFDRERFMKAVKTP